MAINAIIWTLLFVYDEAGTNASLRKQKKHLKNGNNNTKWSMSRDESFSKKFSHHELKSFDNISKSLPSIPTPNNNDVMQYSTDDSFYNIKKSTKNYSLLQYEGA
eukprot:345651_1